MVEPTKIWFIQPNIFLSVDKTLPLAGNPIDEKPPTFDGVRRILIPKMIIIIQKIFEIRFIPTPLL